VKDGSETDKSRLKGDHRQTGRETVPQTGGDTVPQTNILGLMSGMGDGP